MTTSLSSAQVEQYRRDGYLCPLNVLSAGEAARYRTLLEAAEADRRTLLSRLGRQDLQETIVGAESGLRPCMERVELVSGSDVPVLLLGETGSGKEVVARAIHTRSRRTTGPFLRVNCGAIPPELVDSELFGHERGSFTGAVGARKGWFERADGGTLFLDEVGELPPAAQVRLLRIVQDGSFERVGGEHALQRCRQIRLLRVAFDFLGTQELRRRLIEQQVDGCFVAYPHRPGETAGHPAIQGEGRARRRCVKSELQRVDDQIGGNQRERVAAEGEPVGRQRDEQCPRFTGGHIE